MSAVCVVCVFCVPDFRCSLRNSSLSFTSQDEKRNEIVLTVI